MLVFAWSLSDNVVSSVTTDGSSNLKYSRRVGDDESRLYILSLSLIEITDGSDFTLLVDDDSKFNTLEASLWKIFVLTV